MTKFKVPELPTDVEIVNSYPCGVPVSELLPAMWMRDTYAIPLLKAKDERIMELEKELSDANNHIEHLTQTIEDLKEFQDDRLNGARA